MSTTDAWRRATVDLVSRSHRMPPDGLPGAVDVALRELGVSATVYVVDVEQELLPPRCCCAGDGPSSP